MVHNPFIISPLEAPARDMWLLDRTLGETMERELLSAGLIIEKTASMAEAEDRAGREVDGAFILYDSVACSRVVIRRFIRSALKRRGPVSLVCSLPQSFAINYLSRVNGLDPAEGSSSSKECWTAPFYFVRGKQSTDNAEPLVLPYKERVIHYSVPPGLLGHKDEVFAISDSYLCNVNHWIHIHRINMAAFAAYWFDRLRSGLWVGGVLWYAWRGLVGFPWIGGRLIESLRSVSVRSQVHHSAHIELSVVQKGAIIGPHAIISKSFVSEGAYIMDGAQVNGSVIGRGAVVGKNSIVFVSVVYPGALASQLLMQGSVLGENSCALTNSGFTDINFTRNVRVAHRGGYADIGTPYLGVCVGPEARISAGVWVASGREVPKGALLVMPPTVIAQRFDEIQPGEPAIIRDGRVVPLDTADSDGKGKGGKNT
jgi:acetyltransferase-like isoleucine patch superfamily enzyme